MIKPVGSDVLHPLYVLDDAMRADLAREAGGLPAVTICSAAAGNAVMLGAGYFTPLKGFMNRVEALGVAEKLMTPAGVFFPVPILNMVPDPKGIKAGTRLALRDPNVAGHPVLAIQTVEAVEEFSEAEMKLMTQKVFRTEDPKHPGVQAFNSVGRYCVSGPLQVLNYSYVDTEIPQTFRTAYQIRQEMEGLGWHKVVAFQTRNPMHRAHEELCRMAYHDVKADGILIHMLLGKLKPGDIPADVRDNCIRTMVEHYFEPNTVLITGYGFDMLYAGPREAVLHALFRQNCGCTHLIVGRDHAGVGDYYGPFDAQTVFDEEVPKGVGHEITGRPHAWSKKSARW